MNSSSIAMGYLYLLELNLRYAQICHQLSDCTRCHCRKKENETLEIWTQGLGVGHCKAAMGYTWGFFIQSYCIILTTILLALKTCYLFFSWATPSITMVIPVMDHLDQHLTTSALDLSLPASIHPSATLGKRTLNKYYMMRNLSEVYQITMSTMWLFLYYYFV